MNDSKACPCDEAHTTGFQALGVSKIHAPPKFAFNIRLRTLEVLIFPRVHSSVLGSLSVWPEGDKD